MSQEAAQALLHNIYTFVCIADHAATTKVASWDAQSIHNALQWAAYCQQLAVQVQGQRLEPVLEGRLQEMSHLIDCQSPSSSQSHCINLLFLSKAVDVLVERLVHNPLLSDGLLQNLQHTVETQYTAHVSTLQRNLAAAKCDLQFRAAVATKLSDLGILCKSKNSSPDFPQSKLEVQTGVRLLLEQLTLEFEMGQDVDRFEKHLKCIAERLHQLPHGWCVLVMCLSMDMSKVEKECREGLRYVQHLLAAWIVTQYQTSGATCQLWQVSPSLLVQAAEQNVQFCDWYLSALQEMADTVEASYTANPLKSTFHNPLYSWGLPAAPRKPVFDNILQHLSHMLTADSVVKNKTLAVLTSKTSCRSFSVWTDLTKSLITQLT